MNLGLLGRRRPPRSRGKSGAFSRALSGLSASELQAEANLMNKEVQTNCPDESVLEKIAAGICPPEIESVTLQHAAQCNVCGPRLRRYMKIFSPAQPSDAEVALLNQLQTSRPEWHRKNVLPPTSDHVFAQALKPVPWWRKLAGASAEMFKSLVWERPRMVMAGAALALAVFAVVEGPTIVGSWQIKGAKK